MEYPSGQQLTEPLTIDYFRTYIYNVEWQTPVYA